MVSIDIINAIATAINLKLILHVIEAINGILCDIIMYWSTKSDEAAKKMHR
jgi:hypothetical protein